MIKLNFLQQIYQACLSLLPQNQREENDVRGSSGEAICPSAEVIAYGILGLLLALAGQLARCLFHFNCLSSFAATLTVTCLLGYFFAWKNFHTPVKIAIALTKNDSRFTGIVANWIILLLPLTTMLLFISGKPFWFAAILALTAAVCQTIQGLQTANSWKAAAGVTLLAAILNAGGLPANLAVAILACILAWFFPSWLKYIPAVLKERDFIVFEIIVALKLIFIISLAI